MKTKKKKHSVMEQVKASRKQSRKEELTAHGKAINYRKVMASKKLYNRKKIRQTMRFCLILLWMSEFKL
jgi:hypothetical protein